jgi:hypothetical protein
LEAVTFRKEEVEAGQVDLPIVDLGCGESVLTVSDD